MCEEPRVIPSFYINVGGPTTVVSALKLFEHNVDSPPWIISGDSDGCVKVWNSHTRRLHQTVVSEKGDSSAVLWLDTFKGGGGFDYLTVQRRFSTALTTLKLQSSTWTTIDSLSLNEPHSGFCTGDVSSTHMIVPQGEKTCVLYTFANESWGTSGGESHSEDDQGNVTALRLVPGEDGRRLMVIAGYESGALLVLKHVDIGFEVVHKVTSQQHHEGPAASILSVDYDVRRDVGVASTSEDFIFSFDMEGNVRKRRELPTQGVSQIRIRTHDSKLAVGASWDSTLRLFSWLKPNKLKPLGALRFHQEGLTCVDCSGSTGWVTCGGKDGKLTVWKDLYSS